MWMWNSLESLLGCFTMPKSLPYAALPAMGLLFNDCPVPSWEPRFVNEGNSDRSRAGLELNSWLCRLLPMSDWEEGKPLEEPCADEGMPNEERPPAPPDVGTLFLHNELWSVYPVRGGAPSPTSRLMSGPTCLWPGSAREPIVNIVRLLGEACCCGGGREAAGGNPDRLVGGGLATDGGNWERAPPPRGPRRPRSPPKEEEEEEEEALSMPKRSGKGPPRELPPASTPGCWGGGGCWDTDGKKGMSELPVGWPYPNGCDGDDVII